MPVTNSPENNIYLVPEILDWYFLSNHMCFLLTNILHPKQERRIQTLGELKDALQILKANINHTPWLLRDTLGHPMVEEEECLESSIEEVSPQKRRKSFDEDLRTVVDFRVAKLSDFTLKYLAKFIQGAI